MTGKIVFRKKKCSMSWINLLLHIIAQQESFSQIDCETKRLGSAVQFPQIQSERWLMQNPAEVSWEHWNGWTMGLAPGHGGWQCAPMMAPRDDMMVVQLCPTLHLLCWPTCGGVQGIHFFVVYILMFVVHNILCSFHEALSKICRQQWVSHICAVCVSGETAGAAPGVCGKSLCGTLSVADLCGRVCQILPHCGDPAAAQLGGGEVPVCNQHLRQHHHGHVLPRYLVPERSQSCPS